MKSSESFFNKLMLSVIPLCLGSFVFIGVIENYKDDSNLKIKLLEDYYKPSRELIVSCLEKQNELFLQYHAPAASLKLITDELIYSFDNPSTASSMEYGVLLKSLVSSQQDASKKLKELEVDVKSCRAKVFNSLESLSLATGTFTKFSTLAKEREQKTNDIYKKRSEEGESLTNEIDVSKLQELMRSVVSIDFNSSVGQDSFKNKVSEMLPVIEKNGEIMSRTEKQIYDVELAFYLGVRNETAKEISNQFKEGFFGWLF